MSTIIGNKIEAMEAFIKFAHAEYEFKAKTNKTYIFYAYYNPSNSSVFVNMVNTKTGYGDKWGTFCFDGGAIVDNLFASDSEERLSGSYPEGSFSNVINLAKSIYKKSDPKYRLMNEEKNFGCFIFSEEETELLLEQIKTAI